MMSRALTADTFRRFSDKITHGEVYKMKKALSLITILLCIMQAAFSQAPELKNIMPNSYQKLTRLSEAEERAFMEREEAIKAVSAIDNYHIKQKPLSELHYQVFAETDCGLQFYRLLVSESPLEAAYTAEYKSKTITADENLSENTVFQIVFIKTKTNAFQKIGLFPYADKWATQGKTEGFTFNDLMIKTLNKSEIGFFVTEVSVGFVVDRSKLDENKVKIDYYTCKNQIAAYNRTWFSKYHIDESITDVSKDSIDIQASDCLFDAKCPLKYSIQNAFDGNPSTSYVENTEDDLMKIIFRKIALRKDLEIKFAVTNGYASNASLYTDNNRIKKCGVANGKNTPFLVELSDMDLNYQIKTINRDESAYTGLFEVVAEEVYLGKKYNDTCLAELNFWDYSEKEWLFGDL